MVQMKILYLSSWLPYPLYTGSSVTNYNAIKQLARHHDISLLSFIDSPEELQYVPKMAELCHDVTCVLRDQPWVPRLRHQLALLSPSPRSVVMHRSREMTNAIRSKTREKKFDCAVADATNTIEYVLPITAFPKVLYHHNVDSMLAKRQCALESSHWRRSRLWLTWLKGAAYEKRVSRAADAHIVVSEVDRGELLALLPEIDQVEVIGNGIDLDTFRVDGVTRQRNSIIFTGLPRYIANMDGLRYFHREILPLIKPKLPEFVLRVTGDISDQTVDDLTANGSIVFTGHLDDIKPAVASSWVSVVPIRIGSGTRLKILEAMALGTPVVSTTIGAEGLETTHQKDILIADTPSAFAEHLIRLCRDTDLWQTLSENGRRLVEQKYDWNLLGRRFERFLARVCDKFSPATARGKSLTGSSGTELS